MIPLDAALLAAWPLPVDNDGDKFSRGTVLIVGGSATTPGAVVLAGMAALRMGAGRLQIATAAPVASAMAVAVPEALVLPVEVDAAGNLVDIDDAVGRAAGAADAVLVGSGMRSSAPPHHVMASVLEALGAAAIVVVDAAALGTLPDLDPALVAGVAGRLALTPNRQEIADLVGARSGHDGPDPCADAAQLARELGAVITSFGDVHAPDGTHWHTDAGHPSLGTSGSGDVLAGMTAGAAARCRSAAQAACWATLVHVRAGEHLGARNGPLGFLARELIGAASEAVHEGHPFGGRSGVSPGTHVGS